MEQFTANCNCHFDSCFCLISYFTSLKPSIQFSSNRFFSVLHKTYKLENDNPGFKSDKMTHLVITIVVGCCD